MGGLYYFTRVYTICMGSTKEAALCHLDRELLHILSLPAWNISIFLKSVEDCRGRSWLNLLDTAEEHHHEAAAICLHEHTSPVTKVFMPGLKLRRGTPPSIVHRVDVIGVSCYTSTDLINWKYEGALSRSAALAFPILSCLHVRQELVACPPS